MYKFFNRKLSLIILVFISLLVFSCGTSQDEAAPYLDSGVDINTEGNDESEIAAAVPERLHANVPTVDFGGYEFRILTFSEVGNPVHDHPDLTWTEEDMGDILNDAVFRRNTDIEERFNIEIREIRSTNHAEDVRRAILAQSDEFDIVGQRMIAALTPISSGFYLDLHSLPNLDLSKPWYLQNSVENLTLDGRLFTVLSEMLISPYSATSVIVFNKQLHEDLALADPYQMVRDGAWTIGALFELSRHGSRDLNGDGMMTFSDDQWGFMCQRDSMIAFLIGGGGQMGRINADGSPELVFANEKNFSIMDKAFNLMYDEAISFNIQKPGARPPGLNDNEASAQLWTSGRALFGWTRIGNIRLWREMDTLFGILPMPKYDESQENYYSLINPWQAMGIAVPVTASDINRTTIIMEALSAESRYTLQPAYHESALRMRDARDDESSEMLDIIFGNTVIDPVITFNFADFSLGFMTLLNTLDRNLQSFYDRNYRRVENEIQRFMSSINEE